MSQPPFEVTVSPYPLWAQLIEVTIATMVSMTIDLSITFITTVVIPLTIIRILLNALLYPLKLMFA